MITSLYIGILGLLYFVISISVIRGRLSNKVALGSGGKDEILHLTSAHSNFASYSPLFLILIFLIETQKFYPIIIHILCLIFVFGRILHFYSMKEKIQKLNLRRPSMMMTFNPIIVASVINIYLYFKNLFA